MKANKAVLIITYTNDNSAIEGVTSYLKKQGIPVIRFNSDLYPTKIKIESYQGSDNEQILTTEDNKQYALSDIGAIWYRRFHTGSDLPRDIDSQTRKTCIEESKRTLLGYFDALNVFKVDDYWTIRRASCKELQLIKAREHNIDIPDTLTTNNPEAVVNFFHKHQGNIISKMQTAFAIYKDGKESVVYTNPVKENDLEKLSSLNLCPMVFQQALAKELELRATIVGDKIFCIAIDSNKFQEQNYDWRKKGSTTLDAWFPYQLPKTEEEKLIKLTRSLGLNYGAADYILTPSGELKFLEINPCGEFYWADKYQNQGICEAIGELFETNLT